MESVNEDHKNDGGSSRVTRWNRRMTNAAPDDEVTLESTDEVDGDLDLQKRDDSESTKVQSTMKDEIEELFQYIVGNAPPKREAGRKAKKTRVKKGFMSSQRRRRPRGWLECTELNSLDEMFRDIRRKQFIFDWMSDHVECKGQPYVRPVIERSTRHKNPIQMNFKSKVKASTVPLEEGRQGCRALKGHAPEASARAVDCRKQFDKWVAKQRRRQLVELQRQAAARVDLRSKRKTRRSAEDDMDKDGDLATFARGGGSNLDRHQERKFRNNYGPRTKTYSSDCPKRTSNGLPSLRLYSPGSRLSAVRKFSSRPSAVALWSSTST